MKRQGLCVSRDILLELLYDMDHPISTLPELKSNSIMVSIINKTGISDDWRIEGDSYWDKKRKQKKIKN